MNKYWIIVRHEYLKRIKKKSFILLTLLTPLLMIAVMTVPMFLMMSRSHGEGKKVVVLDSTKEYAPLFEDNSEFDFIIGDKDLETYRKESDGDIYAYVVISDDPQTNPRAVSIYTSKQITSSLEQRVRALLLPTIRDRKIASYDIPQLKKIIDDTKVSLNISTVRWGDNGSENKSTPVVANVIGQIFNLLSYFFIIMYGAMVMGSVQEEKKNRIVEIIVSSVNSTTLMLGKITGVGLVGLTQMLIWFVLLMAGFLGVQLALIGTASVDFAQLAQQVQGLPSETGNPNLVGLIESLAGYNFAYIGVVFILYFIFGYLIYASIYAALGGIFESQEESQQAFMPITLLLLLTFYFGMFAANNPDAPMSVVTSIVPLTSPIVMMARIAFDPPVWQVIVSILILVLFSAFMIWAAAKIFRMGLLMYGKKTNLKNIVRWMRYK